MLLHALSSSPAKAGDPALLDRSAGCPAFAGHDTGGWCGRRVLTAAAVVVIGLFSMPTSASAETVLLHAAGSLRGALTEVAKAFEAASGATVQMKYGPSGVLKDGIANGEKAEVFAS